MNSSAALRRQKLDEREAYILDLVKENTPLASIAKLTGTNQDYCGDLIEKLVKEYGLTYAPAKPGTEDMPVGVTSDSHTFRNNLAPLVYDLRETDHHLQIARDTGLLNIAQRRASSRPHNHDWTLSQLERLARRLDIPFKEMMLKALLTDNEWKTVERCIAR